MKKRKSQLLRVTYPKVIVFLRGDSKRFRVDDRSKGGGLEEFSTKDEALRRAKEIAASRYDGIFLSEEDRATFAHYTTQFKPHGYTVKDILESSLQELVAQKRSSPEKRMTVSELVDLWLSEKESQKLKKIREVTLKAIRLTAKRIKKLWAKFDVNHVTKASVEKYLTNLDVSLTTKNNYRIQMGGFFEWCIKKDYATHNPCKFIEIGNEDEKEPEIVPVESVKKMFEFAGLWGKYRLAVKHLALGFFAGLRPDEIVRLPPKNIDLTNKTIRIEPQLTKVKSARYVPINDTLLAFLTAYKNEKLHPINLRRKLDKLKEVGGYSVRGGPGWIWSPDAIRHTFGSMWLAANPDKGINHLAEIMGNSPNVIKKHYKQAVPPAVAETYWAICPTGNRP